MSEETSRKKLTFKKREKTSYLTKRTNQNIETFYSSILKENLIVSNNNRKYLGSVFQLKNKKWRVKIETSEKSLDVPYSITIVLGGFEDEDSARNFQREMCLHHGLLRNLMIDRGDHIEMTLTNRGITLIDKDDFHKVDQYLWFGTVTNGGVYARRIATEEDKDDEDSRQRYALHNHVMDFLPNKDGTGDTIDHINRNSLDNRKCNLRVATKFQQAQNRSQPAVGKTGHRNIILGNKNGSQYYELRVTANKKRKRAYFFWNEYNGAQGALEKAIELRDRAQKILKENEDTREKLEKNEITLKDI